MLEYSNRRNLAANQCQSIKRSLKISFAGFFSVLLSLFLVVRANPALACQTDKPDKIDDQNQTPWVQQVEPGVITIGQASPWANLHNISVSPDGKLIAGQDSLNQVVVIGVKDQKVIATQMIEQGQITSMTFSPKGNRLAVVIFDVRDRTKEVADDEDPDLAKQPARNSLIVLDENFSPELDMPIPPYRYGTRGTATVVDVIHDCVFSESGEALLLSGPGGPRAVDLKTQEIIYHIAEDLRENGFFVSDSLIYFPRKAAVWDIWKNRLETSDRFLPLKQSQVIDVHPESGYVLAAQSSEVFLFNLKNQSRKSLTTKNPYLQSWQLSGDAKKVVGFIQSNAGTEIGIWNVASGKQVQSCNLPTKNFANFGFINDSQQLIIECYSGNKHQVAIVNLDSNFNDSLLAQLSNLPVTKNIAIGNNNRWAVIDDGRLLIDLEDGQQSGSLPLDFAGNTGFSVELTMNSKKSQLVQLTSDGQTASLTSASLKDISEKPKTTSYQFRSKENRTVNLIVQTLGGQPRSNYLPTVKKRFSDLPIHVWKFGT